MGTRAQAGEYSAWDCLNDFYGLESMQVNPSFGRSDARVVVARVPSMSAEPPPC